MNHHHDNQHNYFPGRWEEWISQELGVEDLRIVVHARKGDELQEETGGTMWWALQGGQSVMMKDDDGDDDDDDEEDDDDDDDDGCCSSYRLS